MEQLASGNSLTLTAPAGGVTRGKALMHGERFVVPAESATVGQNYTAYTKGIFEDHQSQLLAGVTPDYEGEAAYWKDGLTTEPTGAVKVGYFHTEHNSESLELTGA